MPFKCNHLWHCKELYIHIKVKGVCKTFQCIFLVYFCNILDCIQRIRIMYILSLKCISVEIYKFIIYLVLDSCVYILICGIFFLLFRQVIYIKEIFRVIFLILLNASLLQLRYWQCRHLVNAKNFCDLTKLLKISFYF